MRSVYITIRGEGSGSSFSIALTAIFTIIFLNLSLVSALADDSKAGESSSTKVQVDEGPLEQINEYSSKQTILYNDGSSLDRIIINGPPTPPPGYDEERKPVPLPKPDGNMAAKTLVVPGYNWVFGCSAVSGAMIAGYYDRNGYPNMYTGPTGGGLMPLDNSPWPTWSDGYRTYPNLPLAASHQGVDGRTTRGSIDDYWVQYGSSSQDPYVSGGWGQHSWSDAIGDYMKTSQSAYNNTDASTAFYNWTSRSDQLTCNDMISHNIHHRDGTYGRKLFYEARGYRVTECYNQKTDNNGGGFTFAHYKAEIDAGRPVMLNVQGHTMVGVGYDDSGNTVYLHDTWDYNTHSMTWGGSYSGMALRSVSIVNLEPSTVPPPGANRILPILTLMLGDDEVVNCPAITNGDLESGQSHWAAYSSNGLTIIGSSASAHSGSYMARFGGIHSETAYIQQQVSVPSSCPYLSYYHYIDSGDACGYDYGYVRLNGSTVMTHELCSSSNTGGWVKRVLNLNSYANQTVTLQFRVYTDSSLTSNWYIDDISFQSSPSM